MEKVYKLEKPKVVYTVYEYNSTFYVIQEVTFKGKRDIHILAEGKTYSEARKWIEGYERKLAQELWEDNLNEIKESYTGFEGSRD